MIPSSKILEIRKSLVVESCTKANVPQMFGLHGESGGGKSATAFVLAIGLVGAESKIGVIDGENRRSGWAFDAISALCRERYGRIPEVIRIPLDDCHPLHVAAAIEELQARGCAAIIADCMTQAWERYLDIKEEALERMAGDDLKRREKCAMAAAAHVKPVTHSFLIRTTRACKAHLILCFRGKRKTVMGKEEGRTTIKQDEFSTPIQETGLIFDCLVAGEIVARDGVGGYCLWRGPARKTTHPDIIQLLPKEDEQFHFSHSEALRDWMKTNMESHAPTATLTAKPAAQPVDDLKVAKMKLWKALEPVRGEERSWKAAQQWLWDEGFMLPEERVETATVEQINALAERVTKKLI